MRRAYKAYTLLSLDYEEGDGMDDGDAPNVVTWRFNLPQSHSPPATPQLYDRPSRFFETVADLRDAAILLGGKRRSAT